MAEEVEELSKAEPISYDERKCINCGRVVVADNDGPSCWWAHFATQSIYCNPYPGS